MAILGVVLTLVGRTLIEQQRLYRDLHLSEIRKRAAQQGVQILAAELEALSPDDGDIVPGEATDSAVEFESFVGAAISCASHGATVRLSAPLDTAPPVLATYVTTPEVGDRVLVFDPESGVEEWRTLAIVDVRRGGAACAWAGPLDGFTLSLDSAVNAQPMTVVRIARRTRYSLYRGGDQQWYLGMRDWNAASGHFNTIQPVSGPYLPYNSSASLTGLRFTYRDSSAHALGIPVVNPTGVRRIDVVVRAANGGDSLARLIALRHAR